MVLQDYVLFLYNISLIPVIFFSLLYLFIAFINIFTIKQHKVSDKKIVEFPFVSVQIPTFNDPVAVNCIEKCLKFDYPKDKYEILIVDDSTNVKTQEILKIYAKKYLGFIKYIHRDNREGYKSGALMEAMSITKGEILVVFDADWLPPTDFLKTITKPFSDKKVAIVQARQGFSNKNTNLISRFAAYLLMTYHTNFMPLNNIINCVFFCGTAGALRRSAFEKVGGWNSSSLTEDSDLSVRLLKNGYKTVYIPLEVLSEVPDTFESFIKQQMRWCYGNARVFIDNFKDLIFSGKFNITQKLMIGFITLANLAAPFVVTMTFFGFAGWFLGEPELFKLSDLIILISRFAITGGFLLLGAITLYRNKILNEFGYFVVSSFTVGIILSFAMSFAFFKAIFNSKLVWFCTPKVGNASIKGVK